MIRWKSFFVYSFILVAFFFMFVGVVSVNMGQNNDVFADVENALEENKNHVFNVNDINSQEVKSLYNPSGTTVPSRFHLKEELKSKYNITIPVDNQSSLGLCDNFSTTKCVETNYALKTGTYINISERYLDYILSKGYLSNSRTTGVLGSGGSEGDGMSAGAILAFLESFGAPTESEVPYQNYQQSGDPAILNATSALMVNSTVLFPSLQDLADSELKNRWIDIIKIHLMKYGGIRTVVASPDGENSGGYNRANFAQNYVLNSNSRGGHAVCIVGWDDNYSKNNFTTIPEGNGAFIALNSWGTSFGDGGYYYISYYDDNVLKQLCGVIDTRLANSFNTYSTSSLFYNHMGYGWGRYRKNFLGFKFTNKNANEYFSHATIGIGCESTFYSKNYVKVYLNPIDDTFDKSKMLFLETSYEIPLGKYMSINLKNPVKLSGTKFSLVFEIVVNENATGDNISFQRAMNDSGEMSNLCNNYQITLKVK